jgi:AraC-like DNA-binding protein
MSDTTAPLMPPQRQDGALQALLRRAELAACIERHAVEEGVYQTAIPRLALVKSSSSPEARHDSCEPALQFLVQGRRRLLVGMKAYVQRPSEYLVVTHPLPLADRDVVEPAAPPTLGIHLEYDVRELAELATAMGLKKFNRRQHAPCAIAVVPATAGLLDAVLRLVRLLDAPEDIQALAPLTIREILYRTLRGPAGAHLAELAHTGSSSRRVARATAWIRRHYDMPLRLEALAKVARMSISTLRAQFKAATMMTPSQYQMRVRLRAARAMLIAGRADEVSAGRKVGYRSAARFAQDYAWFFGVPPAVHLRAAGDKVEGGLPLLGDRPEAC